MTAVLVAVVRFVLVLWIVRLIFHAFTRRTAARRPTSPGRPAVRVGGSLVRDPQCGTYVSPERSIVADTMAGRQHFCSTACRDAWLVAHHSGVRA
jgi:uncharacterized protein